MVFHFPEAIFKLAGICVPRRFLNQEKLARTCFSRISIFSNHVGMFEIHIIPVFVQLSRKQPRKHQFFPEFSSNLEFLCSLAIHNFSEKSRVNEFSRHFECLICDQRYMVSKIGEIQPKSRVSEFSRTSLFYKSCRDV